MSDATRACLDCGTDISARHWNARRCEACGRLSRTRVDRAARTAPCIEESAECVPGRLKRGMCETHYRRWKRHRGGWDRERACAACGEVFMAQRPEQVTCSNRCYMWDQSHPGQPRALVRRCEGCGSSFTPPTQAQLHCDSRCRAAASKRRCREIQSAYVRHAVCATCAGPMPDHVKAGTKYCSRVCGRRDKAAERLALEARGDVQCARCPVVFKPRSLRHATCSPKCSKLWHWEQNRELYTSRALAWMAANPERTRANNQAWQAANADAVRERNREWARAHPDKVQIYGQRRRAAKLENPGSVGVSHADWQRMLNRHQGCCAYCGDPTDKVHMEHVIPLSRGGRHAIGNVLPTCPRCNLTKRDCFLVEWRYGKKRRRPRQEQRDGAWPTPPSETLADSA